MYAQMVKAEGAKSREEMSEQERAFQDRIDRGEKIEPKEGTVHLPGVMRHAERAVKARMVK